MSPTPAFPRTRLPARRHWAAWLVVALLWAQVLGVWHHTVHAPGLKALRAASADSVAPPAQPAQQAQAAAAREGSYPLHHSPNSADCRLLDQLLLADGLASAAATPVALPAVPATAPCATVAQVALAASRPYLARAPPARG